MEIKNLHTHIDIVTRSKGHSVVAKASYNARAVLKDEYYGKIHRYNGKDDLVFSKIFLPNHIPKKFEDREFLWNEVERIEKSKNSQLARNLIFTLPRELNKEDRIKLLSEFVEENFTSKGMIADCNIHNPLASDNGEQPHARILLTLREIDDKGNWKAKSRKEYILDENGEKIKLPSGNYKSKKINMNDWNDIDKAKKWREDFLNKANEYLAKNNIDKRIDPRTFKEQGREELPQIHLGTASYQMEKRGIRTERGNINRRIIYLNSQLKKFKNELASIGNWIANLTNKVMETIKGFSKETELSYKENPSLFDIYSYLKIYSLMQEEKAQELFGINRERKERLDSKKNLNTISYMRKNNLKTILDIQLKKDELFEKMKDIKDRTQYFKDEIKNCETLLKQASIINENKSVINKYKGMYNSLLSKLKKQTKADYYKEHKEEIDKYQRAIGIVKKVSGEVKLNSKKWKEEISSYDRKIKLLEYDNKDIKEELSQINHIKYIVDKVNERLGIDIKIEIDIEIEKAIEKGEKPSIYKALERVKRDQEKHESTKEMITKSKSMDYER